MKNADYIYLTEHIDGLKETQMILKALQLEAQEECKHYSYDTSAFEDNCAVSIEVNCLKCDKFEPRAKKLLEE